MVSGKVPVLCYLVWYRYGGKRLLRFTLTILRDTQADSDRRTVVKTRDSIPRRHIRINRPTVREPPQDGTALPYLNKFWGDWLEGDGGWGWGDVIASGTIGNLTMYAGVQVFV